MVFVVAGKGDADNVILAKDVIDDKEECREAGATVMKR